MDVLPDGGDGLDLDGRSSPAVSGGGKFAERLPQRVQMARELQRRVDLPGIGLDPLAVQVKSGLGGSGRRSLAVVHQHPLGMSPLPDQDVV